MGRRSVGNRLAKRGKASSASVGCAAPGQARYHRRGPFLHQRLGLARKISGFPFRPWPSDQHVSGRRADAKRRRRPARPGDCSGRTTGSASPRSSFPRPNKSSRFSKWSPCWLSVTASRSPPVGTRRRSLSRPSNESQSAPKLSFATASWAVAPTSLGAARDILDGNIAWQQLPEMTSADARGELMKLRGVGQIADCVLLFARSSGGFSSGRLDRAGAATAVFPKTQTHGQAAAALRRYPLRPHAGLAQQYLFHYARVHLKLK